MSREGPQPRRRTVIRYHDMQGNHCRSTDPGAIRTVSKTQTWYVRVGKRWESLGTTDLGEAWIRLRAKKYGTPAPPPVSFDTHLQAFRTSLEHRGLSAKQVYEVVQHVKRIAALAGWRTLSDLTPDSLLRALNELKQQGRSAQTRKHYFRHAFQFGRWLTPGKLPANPFAGMAAPQTSVDRRHDRRCPTEAELAQLWLYLHRPDCPRRRGMTGKQRKMGYLVCMGTGFRADELRTLEREMFGVLSITLPAAADKRRKPVVQPIPAWLGNMLSDYFASGGGMWRQFPASGPGRVLKADLLAAGVEYVTEGPDGPLYFDFHSLRVWYVTQLAHQPGISPKTLMHLARHSDPRLTLSVYAKAQTQGLRDVVEQLPAPGGS